MSIAGIDLLEFCSQQVFIHASLSRIPFVLVRLSCCSINIGNSSNNSSMQDVMKDHLMGMPGIVQTL